MPPDTATRQDIGEAFMAFNEPTYLHQVIAKQTDGRVRRFKDLPDAQMALVDEQTTEWRSHFHIPIFLEDLGTLHFTQSDINNVLAIQPDQHKTRTQAVAHNEWRVIPKRIKM